MSQINAQYVPHSPNATTLTTPLESFDNFAMSQRPYTYFKDLNDTYDKFTGTWTYVQNDTSLKVTFFKREKLRVPGGANTWKDELGAFIELKVENQVIFETYSEGRISIHSIGLDNQNQMEFSYGEPSLNSCYKYLRGILSITFSVNSTNNLPQLSWERTNDAPRQLSKLPCDDGTLPDMTGFQIPANLVLTKQP